MSTPSGRTSFHRFVTGRFCNYLLLQLSSPRRSYELMVCRSERLTFGADSLFQIQPGGPGKRDQRGIEWLLTS
jgi:hypothetical protein